MANISGTIYLEVKNRSGDWGILQSRVFADAETKEKEEAYLRKAKTRWETTYYLTEQLRITVSDKYYN